MYFKHLTRLLHPKQYPLFRIVKLRYIFLHIIIISTLLSLPSSMNYYQLMNIATQLVASKQTEIPEFKIINNELKLSGSTHIKVEQYDIFFSNKKITPRHNQMAFQKDGIYVDQATYLPYVNMPVFHDKKSLIQFLNTYTSSRYFYLSVIISVLVFIQFVSTVIKIIFVSTIAHFISLIFRKKSRFMNWLKIITFLLTFPSIILSFALFNSELNMVIITVSWLLLIIFILTAVMYLPKSTRKLKQ